MESDGGFATPPRKLAALSNHADALQVEAFNRAMQRGGGGGGGAGGKLTSLFRLKMLTKPAPQLAPLGGEGYIGAGSSSGAATPPGAAGGGGGSGASPRTPPVGPAAAAAAAAVAAGASPGPLSADDLLTWTSVSKGARRQKGGRGWVMQQQAPCLQRRHF